MRTTFTTRSFIFLPILAALISLAVSAGGCFKCPNCCDAGTESVHGKITKCFEQRAGRPCSKHFYIVFLGNEKRCINPGSKWLKEKINKENLNCPPADGNSTHKSDGKRKEKEPWLPFFTNTSKCLNLINLSFINICSDQRPNTEISESKSDLYVSKFKTPKCFFLWIQQVTWNFQWTVFWI